jgi:hypothetical protein
MTSRPCPCLAVSLFISSFVALNFSHRFSPRSPEVGIPKSETAQATAKAAADSHSNRWKALSFIALAQ